VLAIIASKEENKYLPFYPVLLSAKGWQATHLEKSISTWASKTLQVRQKLARSAKNTDAIPASMFWSAIGTWGAEPKVESVGSGNKSNITPISAFLPKEVGEELLENLFIGKGVIEWMLDLKRQAAEWLGAWSHLAATQAATRAPIPPEGDFMVPPEAEGELDIPF
jgi:hypothetical protein